MSRKTRMTQDLKRRMIDAGTCERDTVRVRHGKPVKVHLDAVVNRTTLKSYKASIQQFCTYCATSKLTWTDVKLMDQPAKIKLIESYIGDVLTPKAYTSATVHTKLAPVCRALDIDMSDIAKPIRRTGDIVRGVEPDANAKGKKELDNPKYARLIEFQRRVGIRRNELKHLHGNDFVDTGHACYVIVRRGKGGKRQKQWIMPEDRDFVKSYFDGSDGPVFAKNEIPPHADLHGLRAQHAQQLYFFWANCLAKRPQMRDKLVQSLVEYAEANGSPNNAEAVRRELSKPVEYKLRGDVARLAKVYGMPTTLDRTAIMAVSILALAHWRANVTVTNYLIKPVK